VADNREGAIRTRRVRRHAALRETGDRAATIIRLQWATDWLQWMVYRLQWMTYWLQ
jgi:hypothetical protein